MVKKYFPAANSGEGFFDRFSGIAPPWERANYTYVLKGGPGVGKNTLMRKAAKRAMAQGYTVEEFRCASDPDSLDALRIVDMGIVLLDGTAPHVIDPRLPGIADGICNLGHFKNKSEFSVLRAETENLFKQNSAAYKTAYTCLGAARLLKEEALAAVSEVTDREKMQKFLSSVIGCSKRGETRELFAQSATPHGVIDYSKSYLRDNTLWLSGIVGEVAMREAKNLLQGRQHTACYDFVIPTLPHTLDTGERSIAIEKNGDSITEFLTASVPHRALFCMSQVERLVNYATEMLAKALKLHDEIEALYRPYVDYEAVEETGEKLLCEIGI